MLQSIQTFLRRRQVIQWLHISIILIIGFFTYFNNFNYPNSAFWDENYHISAAQKYIDGTFFIELHPPLGKLLIAAGEKAFGNNQGVDITHFNTTEYIRNFPNDFSFAGFRIAPAFFAMLSSVWFYFILRYILKSSWLALLFSSLYLFENAYITHFRGAMLDGIQMFFILMTLTLFFRMVESKNYTFSSFLWLGFGLGLAISTKINALILLMLFPFLFYKQQLLWDWKSIIKKFPLYIVQGLSSVVIASVIFFGVHMIHVNLATDLDPDNDYGIEAEYQQVLKERSFHQPITTVKFIKEWWRFSSTHAGGVPEFDICKEGENGSIPITWPFGNKSINYRWEKYHVPTDVHQTYFKTHQIAQQKITLNEYDDLDEFVQEQYTLVTRYLYLQGNPIIWILSLLALILSVTMILGRIAFHAPIKDRRLFEYSVLFLGLYTAYMIVVSSITRVLYLYHYFIPFLFSLILIAIMFGYLCKALPDSIQRYKSHYVYSVIIVSIIFITFIFFSPLSYYLPLSYEQFQLRNWFDWWGLIPIR